MAEAPPQSREVMELALYRWSPLGPIATTLAIGVIAYGLFLLNVVAVENFSEFAANPGGQNMLRIAFILTLILCAALGVSNFDQHAHRADTVELAREFDFHVPARREGGPGIIWASLGGFLIGLGFLGFLMWANTGTDVWRFLTSTGLWFVPMIPLLWMLLARGVYGSIIAGRQMSRLIRDDLRIDLYRHHPRSHKTGRTY